MLQAFLLFALVHLQFITGVWADGAPVNMSRPGGAGHALLFRNNVATVENFKGFPTEELTFEAWISTADFCHQGTILSYSLDASAVAPDDEEAAIHHFVITNVKNVIACHDFELVLLLPDPYEMVCVSKFIEASQCASCVSPGNLTEALNDPNGLSKRITGNLVEADGTWHHLAITWTAKADGRTRIYIDGSLMSDAYTNKTQPIKAGGHFFLGQNQECTGGCSTVDGAFFGMMDEVRIWNSVRTQSQIAHSMRTSLPDDGPSRMGLLAYWKFDEPNEDAGSHRTHLVSKDLSGNGNDLLLTKPIDRRDVTIKQGGQQLTSGKMSFRGNYAVGDVVGMPSQSFTVEFWAKGDKIDVTDWTLRPYSTLFSYATSKMPEGLPVDIPGYFDDYSEGYPYDAYYGYSPSDPTAKPVTPHVAFVDDAIRIERYLQELLVMSGGVYGVVVVSINSNLQTSQTGGINNVAFNASWVDDAWHHVAVTWDYVTGGCSLYFDGLPMAVLWENNKGMSIMRDPSQMGQIGFVSSQTTRLENGSLALGIDQNCPGGCMDPQTAANSELAVVRVWNRVLSPDEVAGSMYRDDPLTTAGLVSQYSFRTTDIVQQGSAFHVKDLGVAGNSLALKSPSPLFVYSTAPLANVNGAPMQPPQPGPAGYALSLSDRQVVMMPDFKQFPTSAITVEFWMFSTDTCRPGTPFSYANGAYGKGDNSFLIFNYNSWGVSVMEDEGLIANHESGVSATDGNWHHIAVTWESLNGTTILYQDGRPVWSAVRAQGKSIIPGGTLVLGREQDCIGGCFDSMEGAVGKVTAAADQPYGPQDFSGLIENVRIWKVVRDPVQIATSRRADLIAASGISTSGKGNSPYDLDPHHPDLVAFWKFDEGAGYQVRDATGNGNDLVILNKPHWEVVRWLATRGNGIVEVGEQCDDGDLDDGNGCSVHCTLEDGWHCHGNPSVCVRAGQQQQKGAGAAARQSSRRRHPGGSRHSARGHTSRRSHLGGGAIFMIVAGCIMGVCLLLAAAIYREQIVRGVTNAVVRLTHPGRPDYSGLDIDTECTDLSPKYTICPRGPDASIALLPPPPIHPQGSPAQPSTPR